MNYSGALLVERMIIESLAKKEKNLWALSEDTGIEENLLKILLQEMLQKAWIKFGQGEYFLSPSKDLGWISEINSQRNLEGEVKELLESMVSLHFKDPQSLFKVQKLELTEDEEKLLNSHLKNLEQFFQNIRHSRMKKPLKGQTKKQKVVVWGAGFYQDLIGANLVAV